MTDISQWLREFLRRNRLHLAEFRLVSVLEAISGLSPLTLISLFPEMTMSTETPLTRCALATKTTGHQARLRILAMLRHNKLSVCQIASVLDVAPSTASGYLTELRRADLVTEQREGKWVYYHLSDEDPTSGR